MTRSLQIYGMRLRMKQNRKRRSRRRAYISQFYRGNHIAFLAASLSCMLTGALNIGIAWVMQQMIDAVSGVLGALELPVLALLTMWIVLLIILFKGMNYASMPGFLKKSMQQYKDYAFQQLTRKSIASFSKENTSDYISAFSNDAATIERDYLEKRFSLLTNAAKLIGSLVMMLVYSPVMTAVACAFFILPVGASLLAGNRMKEAERNVSDKNGRFIAALKDSLSGFSVVKSFRAEDSILELLGQSSLDSEQAKCEKRKLSTVIGALGGVAGVTAQLGTFLAGAYLARAGWGITPGVLLIFIDLTANVIGPLRDMPELLAARKAAIALIDKLAEALESNVRDDGVKIPDRLETGIEVSDVSFGYTPDVQVLHDVNVTFEAGKSCAIVGASGSGKSTLLHLLMAGSGDYSGEIRYDGQELRAVSCESLYEIASLIQQNVFVFNATIRDNITMFRDFPKSEVECAIKRAGLSELIEQRGENYLCGENGSGLSGGEKQRISIARSLLRNASILLVDEATAALDAQTARQVAGSILDLEHVTRIVVTHTLDASLLRRYDRILAMKNGTIVESGSFEDLMLRKGFFYSLYTVTQ